MGPAVMRGGSGNLSQTRMGAYNKGRWRFSCRIFASAHSAGAHNRFRCAWNPCKPTRSFRAARACILLDCGSNRRNFSAMDSRLDDYRPYQHRVDDCYWRDDRCQLAIPGNYSLSTRHLDRTISRPGQRCCHRAAPEVVSLHPWICCFIYHGGWLRTGSDRLALAKKNRVGGNRGEGRRQLDRSHCNSGPCGQLECFDIVMPELLVRMVQNHEGVQRNDSRDVANLS